MRYISVPSVIYTNPEVASVGETTATIKQKGIDADVRVLTMNYSGRYLAENEGGDGIAEIIIDKAHNRVLGVHLIGSYASEMIYGAAMDGRKGNASSGCPASSYSRTRPSARSSARQLFS